MILSYDASKGTWSAWQQGQHRYFDGDKDLLAFLEGHGQELISIHADDLLAHFYCGLSVERAKEPSDAQRLAALVEGL